MTRQIIYLDAEDNEGVGIPGMVFKVYPVDLSNKFYSIDPLTDEVTITGTLPTEVAIWDNTSGGSSVTSVTTNVNGKVPNPTFIESGTYVVLGTIATANGPRITSNVIAGEVTLCDKTILDWAQDKMNFKFTVDASIAGTSGVGKFTIPSPNTNYQISWYEVGNNTNKADNVQVTTANHTIDFGGAGTYQISIDSVCVESGVNDFDTFATANTGDKDKLLTVEQWGSTAWSTAKSMFFGASNVTFDNVKDVPNFKLVNDMSGMFNLALLANPDTSMWDVSNVINFASMFQASSANPDVSSWNTISAENISFMFFNNPVAEPVMTDWVMSSIRFFQGLFWSAASANPDTSKWDTSMGEDFSNMFRGAVAAQPDTTNWVLSLATTISGMFYSAITAMPVVDNWQTPNLLTADNAFNRTFLGNPNVSVFDMSSVTNASGMLASSGFSDANYGKALNAWSLQSLNSGVVFSAGSAKYVSGGSEEFSRSIIDNGFSWTITDGGSTAAVTPLNEIVAWGDSLTAGTGATLPKGYTGILDTTYGYDITNNGTGGQTSTHIAARAGGVPIIVEAAANTIPDTVQAVVMTSVFDEPLNNQYPTTLKGQIAGIVGTLERLTDESYTFTRATDGAAVDTTGGVTFIPDTGDSVNAVNILWMGRNNFTDTATVISDIASVVATLNTSEFVVLSLINGLNEGAGTAEYTDIVTTINATLASTYPNNYLDVRQPLVDAYDSADATDVADNANDLVPASLRTDFIHLNQAGYDVVAEAVDAFINAKVWI